MEKDIFIGDIVILDIDFDELPEFMTVDDMGSDFNDYEAYFETIILDIDEINSEIEVSFYRIEGGQITG